MTQSQRQEALEALRAILKPGDTVALTMWQETELQMRLRQAKEALEYARNIEHDAIRALASARESVRAAKERYEDLFTENEKDQCARIKRGELRASGYDPSMD